MTSSAEVAALGNSLAALTFLQEEENTSRGLYQDLYTRLEEANIAAGVKSSDIVIVDPARIPRRISSPVLEITSRAVFYYGSLVGLLVAGVSHLRDTSLTNARGFRDGLGVSIAGYCPAFRCDNSFEAPLRPTRVWMSKSSWSDRRKLHGC